MDNLSYKTCPLKKATGEDVLVFYNVEITDEDMQELAEARQNGRQLALSVKTKDGTSYVGPAIGRCDRERCGWWNAVRNQCAVVTIAKGVKGLHGQN